MEISMLINVFRMIKTIDEMDLSIDVIIKLKKDLLKNLFDDLDKQDELFKEYIKNRDLDFKNYRINQELNEALFNTIKQEQKIEMDNLINYNEIQDLMNDILKDININNKDLDNEK